MRPSRAETSEPDMVKRKMLSMKSNTSLPWSRKYSAMASAESATRRRTPEGSFIWPKTMTVSFITPDSIISRKSEVPSRVRSPTPAKTELPLWTRAMDEISSVMTTVLPTPAPPKIPVLPPLVKGAIRSMTLMPVSKICTPVVCSEKSGARRWIG
jgi:hypothetical protein